jgi:hypothetical protein
VRFVPTPAYPVNLPTPKRARQARSEGRGERDKRASTIHFLTDLPDFFTVQHVPPRRQSWALVLGLLLVSGCGPVVYLKEVSARTAAALSQAKADGADKQAPYECTKASLYYEKAREDAGRAYFQDAVDWGRRSQDCSRRASALARSVQAMHAEGAPRPNQTCGEL